MDKKTTEKVAHLARIHLREDEVSLFADSMTRLIDLVDTMQAVDTGDLEPMAHPNDATQRLREDIISEENVRDIMQQNAKATEAGLYLVPKVIE